MSKTLKDVPLVQGIEVARKNVLRLESELQKYDDMYTGKSWWKKIYYSINYFEARTDIELQLQQLIRGTMDLVMEKGEEYYLLYPELIIMRASAISPSDMKRFFIDDFYKKIGVSEKLQIRLGMKKVDKPLASQENLEASRTDIYGITKRLGMVIYILSILFALFIAVGTPWEDGTTPSSPLELLVPIGIALLLLVFLETIRRTLLFIFFDQDFFSIKIPRVTKVVSALAVILGLLSGVVFTFYGANHPATLPADFDFDDAGALEPLPADFDFDGAASVPDFKTIQFSNGKIVEFKGSPTLEDIDYVAKQLGITPDVQPPAPDAMQPSGN